MAYYHGSPTGNLTLLTPHVSNHVKSFVYITTNEVIATFYMVKTNWYTYGFKNSSSIPVYTEYYKDGLKDIYKNKTGYLYECNDLSFTNNPTNINGAFVSEVAVPTKSCLEIPDVYAKLLEYEKTGQLIIERYEDLTEKQLANIKSVVLNEILQSNLITNFSEYSAFIKSRFPETWDVACNRK